MMAGASKQEGGKGRGAGERKHGFHRHDASFFRLVASYKGIPVRDKDLQ
jgi:hypothetical protein